MAASYSRKTIDIWVINFLD